MNHQITKIKETINWTKKRKTQKKKKRKEKKTIHFPLDRSDELTIITKKINLWKRSKPRNNPISIYLNASILFSYTINFLYFFAKGETELTNKNSKTLRNGRRYTIKLFVFSAEEEKILRNKNPKTIQINSNKCTLLKIINEEQQPKHQEEQHYGREGRGATSKRPKKSK